MQESMKILLGKREKNLGKREEYLILLTQTLILSATFHQAVQTTLCLCSINHLKESRTTSLNSTLTKSRKIESRRNQETKTSSPRKDSLKKLTTMQNMFVKCTLLQ